MSFNSDEIASIINQLNILYFMPDIQREFVWSQEQVIKLFDSIMRNYPISSFLFWRLDQKTRDKLDIYKFTENYIQDSSHNEKASVAGQLHPILVLDGQQRLTSLLIGLKGSYTIKRKHVGKNNPKQWTKQHLYLDLMKDPLPTDEIEGEYIHYGFKFFENEPQNDKEHHWFKVGGILDYDNQAWQPRWNAA